MELGEFLADFQQRLHVLGGENGAGLPRDWRGAVPGRLRGGSFVLKLLLLRAQIVDLLLGERPDVFDHGRLHAAAGNKGVGDVAQVLAGHLDLKRSPLLAAGGKDVAGVRGDLLLPQGGLGQRQQGRERREQVFHMISFNSPPLGWPSAAQAVTRTSSPWG